MPGMQSLTTDIAIAYVALAVSVAAMLAVLFAAFKSTGRWVCAVVVGGLCLVGCDRDPPDQRLARAEAELVSERALHAETKRLLEAASRDRDDHSKRLVELNTELAAERARHAQTRERLDAAEKAARGDRERYEQQLARANTELARERSLHAETKRLLEAAQRDLEAAQRGLEAAQRDRDDSNKRLAELDTELALEKARHVETRKRLEAAEQRGLERRPGGYAGELYSAVLLNDTELVAGKKGTYHAVRLLSPARESIPKFELGRYRLDTTRHQEVTKAIDELNREVVSVLAASQAVAIFVRGRANNISFRGPGALLAGLCSGNSISYLPYDRSAKKYANAVTQQVLSSTYTNQELPNLRGASIACIAQASMQSAELIILQGEISETTDRSALTADLFLFAGAR